MWLTAENGTGFIDDRLDMNGKLLSLCGDVTARSDDDERIRLAVRVL